MPHSGNYTLNCHGGAVIVYEMLYKIARSSRAHRTESMSAIHCRWNTGSTDGSDVPARTSCRSQWILCADDAASLLPEQHAADPSAAEMAKSTTSAWTCSARWWYVSVFIGTLVTLLQVPSFAVLTAFSGFPRILESTWFFFLNSRPWKYLKTGQVLESPWIHQVILCNISCSVKQVFCLKQDLLIIVTFCFYQLKLSRNHRNRHYMLL